MLCFMQSCLLAQDWIRTSAPVANWSSLASSADGSNLVAVAYEDQAGNFGGLYVSTNSGMTWADRSPTYDAWMSVASSATGTKLVAVQGYYGGGFIYVSTNSGATWAQTSAPSNAWFAVASSADGQKLAAASYSVSGDGLIYTSLDGGNNWMPTAAPRDAWVSLASSADGSILIGVATFGACGGGCLATSTVYLSTDSGATWIGMYTSAIGLFSAVVSSDGTKLAAAGDLSLVSTNGGISWVTNTFGGSGLAASSDSRRLLITTGNLIYVSPDWGTTWTTISAPTNISGAYLAPSADGSQLVLTWNRGYIYKLSTTPAPILSLRRAGGVDVLAWTVPTRGFVLQVSSDMTKWADVNSAPSFTLSNLQVEVTVTASAAPAFFRLLAR